MLEATGLNRSHMPTLYEGSEITGYLSESLANQWGMAKVAVVAGAGDNAAGAIGLGIVSSGQAMISLGTSGVYFAASDEFSSNPLSAVHSFCHAIPNRWHLMSVHLSAASCLQWFSQTIAQKSVVELLEDLDNADIDLNTNCVFLPYLAGERTPHNNPYAKGVFFGLEAGTTQVQMTHAVLEGVAMAFADGADALHESGAVPKDITLIGGGARSEYWRQLIADVLNLTLSFRKGGEVGPALGAARLAQMAMETEKTLTEICPQPELVQLHTPNHERHTCFSRRRQKYKKLYQALLPCF